MAELLGSANVATQFFLDVNQISIDNWTFKLFYKVTTTLLLASSVICSSKQFFGDPINCETNGGSVNEDVLQAYCWMYASFNIPLEFRGACSRREHDGTTLYNSYYQWVAIFLVASAILFYTPRAIWLMTEGGLMKFLAKGATNKIVEDADQKRISLLKTFQEHLHNKYNSYAFAFFVCEQLNLMIVLVLWLVTNRFLKYKFFDYGPTVMRYFRLPSEERSNYMLNPMCEAFPRVAACDFRRYGSGGGQERLNAICILGLNMINDKVFLILWFWYFFLTLFGVQRLLYRIVQLTSSRFRFLVMRWRIHRYFKRTSALRHVEHYIRGCPIGDWFVLYQMSRNINTRFFAEFLAVLSRNVNPCPGIEETEADFGVELKERKPSVANGCIIRVDSIMSLHDKVVDATFEPLVEEVDGDHDDNNNDEDDKKNKQEEEEKNDDDEDDDEEKKKEKRRRGKESSSSSEDESDSGSSEQAKLTAATVVADTARSSKMVTANTRPPVDADHDEDDEDQLGLLVAGATPVLNRGPRRVEVVARVSNKQMNKMAAQTRRGRRK